MASDPTTADAASPRGPAPVWLHGRASDWLFGYGLAYLAAVPLLLGLGALVAPGDRPLWIVPLVVLGVATPHYGATLLRVYERRDERRRYRVFALWITAALALLYAGGLYDRWLGSLLLTAYVSWSPWHFSGQNYGLALLALRRHGTHVTPELKRPLYASFLLSAAIAILAVHVGDSEQVFAAGAIDATRTFQVLQLGVPFEAGIVGLGVLAIAYLASLGLTGWRLRAVGAGAAGLGPVAALAATQALWFALPGAAVLGGRHELQSLLPFTAISISVAHAAQYLWVTSYYARRERPLPEGAGPSSAGRGAARGIRWRPGWWSAYYAKILLAGAAVSLPGLLFAPGLLGASVPNAGGVLVLTFSVVNLHHFVLDGAIWKLRDGRVARILLRAEGTGPPAVDPRRSGLRWGLALVCVLGLGVLATRLHVVALSYRVDREAPPPVLQGAAEQLAFYGRDSAGLWNVLASRYEQERDSERAIDAYRRSIRRDPMPPLAVANRLLWLLLQREGRDGADLEEALGLARYLVERVGDTRAEALQTLALVHAEAGDFSEAVAAARGALEVAGRKGEARRARTIRRAIEEYASHRRARPVNDAAERADTR